MSTPTPPVAPDALAQLAQVREALLAQARALEASQQALQESEERMRTLINATPDIVCFKDGQGRWLEANDADLELFELVGVPYRGKKDSELAAYSELHREVFLTCEETDEKAWRAGTVSRSEEQIPTASGTVNVYDVIKVPVFYPDGSRRGLVVLGRDVTARKRAEEALRASEGRLRRLLETLPDGILIVDGRGRFTFANDAAARVLRRPREALVGHGLDDFNYQLVGPDGRPGPVRAHPLLQGRTRDKLAGAEVILVHPDGAHTVLRLSTQPAPDDPRATVVTFQDVTYRTELERLKSEFLDIASHELRTPLTPLRLLVRQSRRLLAQGQPVDDRTLARIERQTVRLSQMLEDLLDVSRLERGLWQWHPAPLELGPLVAGVVEDLRAQAPERSLRLELPAAPVRVEGDAVRLEQVLANLLDNALKYSPEGSPVEVRLSVDGGAARLSVTDRGAGLSPAQRNGLFTRFYRVQSERTRSLPGLGLGLYICREILRCHGGDIELDTREGAGSTFTAVIPLLDA